MSLTFNESLSGFAGSGCAFPSFAAAYNAGKAAGMAVAFNLSIDIDDVPRWATPAVGGVPYAAGTPTVLTRYPVPLNELATLQ